MNRRDFLRSSGFLVVSFSMRDVAFAQAPQPGRFDGPGTPQLDSWLAIDASGHVTAYTGKVELGHGLLTSQTQLNQARFALVQTRLNARVSRAQLESIIGRDLTP